MTGLSKVIVALDCRRAERRTLELAARLAAGKGWKLNVLFIENIELCHAAALPFVWEVDRLSATLQPFEPTQLQWLLRRQIRQIEGWLAEIRDRRSLPGGLVVERGDYVRTTLAQAGHGDLVVFGSRHRWQVVGLKPAVWVWYDASPEADRALKMAADLAAEEGCQLLVAVAEKDLKPESGKVLHITPDNWLELVRQQGCTAVFCPRTSPLAVRLTDEAPCPVLLV